MISQFRNIFLYHESILLKINMKIKIHNIKSLPGAISGACYVSKEREEGTDPSVGS